MRALPLFARHPRLEMMPSQAMATRHPGLAQRRAELGSKKQHLLFGIPSRRCSFLKPLKVAFKAWLITALLHGVSSGNSQLVESEKQTHREVKSSS